MPATTEAPTPSTSRLSGPTKAAILAAALGPQKAAAAVASAGLKQTEIERLAGEIAGLDDIEAATRQAVVQEFITAVTNGANARDSWHVAQEFLGQVLGPDRAPEAVKRMRPRRNGKPFAFLSEISAAQLAELLRYEQPQVVAIVLRHAPKKRAGEVLSMLPDELRVESVMRLVKANEPSHETLMRIDAVLRKRLSRFAEGPQQAVEEEKPAEDGARLLVEILNHAKIDVERAVLKSLTDRAPELGEQVRASMFIFEDIPNLEARALQTALREIDTGDLARALKGAGEEIKTAVFENVSTNAAEMLKEELETIGRVRRSDVHEAQQKVVMAVRAMIDEGKIDMRRDSASPDAEEEMVE
jgi:flagellar motor switch protein FliG